MNLLKVSKLVYIFFPNQLKRQTDLNHQPKIYKYFYIRIYSIYFYKSILKQYWTACISFTKNAICYLLSILQTLDWTNVDSSIKCCLICNRKCIHVAKELFWFIWMRNKDKRLITYIWSIKIYFKNLWRWFVLIGRSKEKTNSKRYTILSI
jgi:hypothetical protein